MDETTRGESDAWLEQGFAAYCEYIALRQNLCFSVAYDIRDMTLRGNWVRNGQMLLKADSLATFHLLDGMPLRGYTPQHYLSAFVSVYFLIDTYPKEFVNYLDELAAGVKSEEAMETEFGKTLDDLNKERNRWLAKRRG